MLNKLGSRYSSVRTRAAAATIGAAIALVVPAAASAQPGIERSVDGSIATINGSIGDAGNDSANGIASGSRGDIADGIATGDPRATLNGLASGSGGGGGSFTPTQGCNASTISGGAGITSTKHQIGRGGPTSFLVGYETYAIPELIEVFYEGQLIQSTGYAGGDINQ
ncbi:hypothetical protein [Rhodococcus sp. ARC_M6]|uniref:hypothetical protein n=1 Tax=Rhodococcus sp. ARC_M6 TaxID=2928852 RepID=UPI001FB4A2AE|nr:hypothetical protein [Rhodococcus sp. ARC_M6]MCJ0903221.1 hypothetical protein [Rhodococcus sp. ARC_M6]